MSRIPNPPILGVADPNAIVSVADSKQLAKAFLPNPFDSQLNMKDEIILVLSQFGIAPCLIVWSCKSTPEWKSTMHKLFCVCGFCKELIIVGKRHEDEDDKNRSVKNTVSYFS